MMLRALSEIRRSKSYRPRRTATIDDTCHLHVEGLEVRTLLSGTSVLDTTYATYASTLITPDAVTNTTVTGLTPAQVSKAYGFDSITLASGIKGTGAGQTIAIVDAYDDPNIVSDLHVFSQTFGLKDANLTVYKQTVNGQAPAVDSGWAMEIALDVEWAHAMAPDANILLVEANTSSLTNLLAAVDYARSQASVSVISMSWGSSEFLQEASYDSHFTTPSGHQPITFVASSGDSGAPASWPAVSPNVLAVGGTTLSVSSNGTYLSETAWSSSGGGTSRYEGLPSYQSSTVTGSTVRSNPDVAYDANTTTGFAVYDTVASSGKTGWFKVGGTSAGAPQWAALVAIADQGRVASGLSTLGNAQAAIYTLSSSDFHDITSGSNGYSAKAGYDLVTGRGSPIASAVVRDLIAFSGSTSFTVSSSTTTTVVRRPGFPFGGRYRGFAETDDGSPMLSTAMLAQSAVTSGLETTTAQLSIAARVASALDREATGFEPLAALAQRDVWGVIPALGQSLGQDSQSAPDWQLDAVAASDVAATTVAARTGDRTVKIAVDHAIAGEFAHLAAGTVAAASRSMEPSMQFTLMPRSASLVEASQLLDSGVAALADAIFGDNETDSAPLEERADDADASPVDLHVAGWVLESIAVAVALDRSRAKRKGAQATTADTSFSVEGVPARRSRRVREWAAPR